MKKFFLSAVLIFFEAALLSGCAMWPSGTVYRYSEESEYEGVVGDFRVEKFTSIEIDWIAGSVDIVRRTDEMQACIFLNEEFAQPITPESEGLGVRTCIKNGVLSVKYAKSGTRIPSNFKKSLVIGIPESIELNRIEINTVSADLTVEEVALGKLTACTVSGDISVSDIYAREISVETVSGDTEILRTESAEISVDSTSGDLRVNESIFSDLEFDSTSGDCRITLPAEVGYTCTFDTVSGRFSDEFGAEKHGAQYIFGDGTIKIEVDTTSGNVSLKKATD